MRQPTRFCSLSTPLLTRRTLALSLAAILSASAWAAESPISISKTIAPNPVIAGQPVTWTIQVLNSGPAVVRDVVIQETLPKGVRQVTAQGDAYTCQRASDQIRCVASELAPGSSYITIEGIAGEATTPAPASPRVAALGPNESITTLHDDRTAALQGALDQALSANAELTSQNKTASKSLADTQAELVGTQTRLSDLQSQLDAARKDDADSDARLLALESKLDSAIKAAEASRSGSETQLAALQTELDAAKTQDQAQADQLAAEVAKNTQLAAQVAALTSELDQAKRAGEETEALAAKAAQAEDAAKQVDALTRELEASRTALAEQKTATEDAVRRIGEISQELETSRMAVAFAGPLDFKRDCPEGANSEAWLIDHLPGLLQTAIDNPTQDNARTYLCAQSAVMGGMAPIADQPQDAAPSGSGFRIYATWRGAGASGLLELRNAARNGDRQALNDLGVMMLLGGDTPQDVPGGERLLTAAAGMGSVLAAENLSMLYAEGAGVEKDRTRANQWKRVASALEDRQHAGTN